MVYDIAIVGAGPAGLTAAIYGRRAGKSVLILEKETFGGQITHSPKVENYPGFRVLSGMELGDKLVEQAMDLGAELEMDTVTGMRVEGDLRILVGESAEYTARTVIVAAGSHHRTLGLVGEEKLVGHGVSYCAICDGAFHAGEDVAIIGGGNSALQEAVMLSEICRSVTVVQNLARLTGEGSLVAEVNARENVKVIYSATATALLGEGKLSGLGIRHEDGREETLAVSAVFVAIGQVPENEPFATLCTLDGRGYIAAGEDCLTETAGVFVAGDCRTKAIRQVTTATADGAVAALAACRYLDSAK
ncbi:MAG: FAD-dependent oxidoreductase [Clostridia bacterium]|nr:FAD-dependent oxidoreductase [Clostridia bacterium]